MNLSEKFPTNSSPVLRGPEEKKGLVAGYPLAAQISSLDKRPLIKIECPWNIQDKVLKRAYCVSPGTWAELHMVSATRPTVQGWDGLLVRRCFLGNLSNAFKRVLNEQRASGLYAQHIFRQSWWRWGQRVSVPDGAIWDQSRFLDSRAWVWAGLGLRLALREGWVDTSPESWSDPQFRVIAFWLPWALFYIKIEITDKYWTNKAAATLVRILNLPNDYRCSKFVEMDSTDEHTHMCREGNSLALSRKELSCSAFAAMTM